MAKFTEPNDPKKRSILKNIKGVTVDSEEEYREFVRNNPTPQDKVWSRTPFTSEGKWKMVLKEKSNPQQTDTGLERILRSRLIGWGYWKYFEQDYHLSDQKRVDFADTKNKVALEPGAVYWHTPDKVKGEAKSDIGDHPEKVYSPATERDIRKQRMLEEDGWDVLWITTKGVEDKADEIKRWLNKIY